ncbi:MAG: menaquinone-dependent protoporphyrinogen IX dehydrogenase [Pseudomonadota bacterium]
MARFLILYSTIDGHTLTICRRLQAVLEEAAHQVCVQALEAATEVDLAAFDKIVIGASIRYGKHRPNVREFIQRNHAVLQQKHGAFFSVNAVARKPGKAAPETNPYVRKFLKGISWQPAAVAVFAGKINYPVYKPLDRAIIRVIMWLTGGPTDPKSVVEFTDWGQVEEFGRRLSRMVVTGSEYRDGGGRTNFGTRV